MRFFGCKTFLKAKLIASLVLLLGGALAHAQYSSESPRVVKKTNPNEVPEFTVQIDVFNDWREAVEYGFELPFEESALGVAKYESEGALRYILALGTFYTFDEAQTVLSDVCPRYSLNRCQVRYLGRLDAIAPDVASNVGVDQAIVLSQTADDIPTLTEGALVGVEQEYVPRAQKRGAYTIQIAAMYDKNHAEETAERVPPRYGNPIVEPVSSDNGDLIFTVNVGQFDSINEARQLASEACRELELYGCWVKPQLASN